MNGSQDPFFLFRVYTVTLKTKSGMNLPDRWDGFNGRKFSFQIQRNVGVDPGSDDRR